MIWLRITKYNPAYRNGAGHYLKDEWTDFSDIGKIYEGSLVTLEDYERTEWCYINAILLLMKYVNITDVMITEVEKRKFSGTTKDPFISERMVALYDKKNGDVVSLDDVPSYLRLLLRTYVWCKLKHIPFMEVHIGYDFYMYVGLSKSCKSALKAIEDMGLFVEEHISPYLHL